MNIKHTRFLAFKLLMLIIAKQLLLIVLSIIKFYMTFVLLYSSRLLPPVTEIETQRENIYVLM